LVRAGHVTEWHAREAVANLGRARMIRYPHGPFRERVWELRHDLTAYDATYLALAEVLDDAVLLTADKGLAARARRSLGDQHVRQVAWRAPSSRASPARTATCSRSSCWPRAARCSASRGERARTSPRERGCWSATCSTPTRCGPRLRKPSRTSSTTWRRRPTCRTPTRIPTERGAR